MKPIPTKGDELIKSDFDEWGARIACYAFSESPTPFVRDTNRATAETANSSAVRDGTLSELAWEKDLFDELLDRAGLGDVEAIFDTTVTPDPKTKSEMVLAHFAGGLISGTTAREELGYTEQDAPERKPAATDPATKDGAKACGHDHEARKADAMPPVMQNLRCKPPRRSRLTPWPTRRMPPHRRSTQARRSPRSNSPRRKPRRLPRPPGSSWLRTRSPVCPSPRAWPASRSTRRCWSPRPRMGRRAWRMAGRHEDRSRRRREAPTGAEPDAKYRISDECREAVRSTIAKAFETRMSPQQLSDAIRTHGAFSTTRSARHRPH